MMRVGKPLAVATAAIVAVAGAVLLTVGRDGEPTGPAAAVPAATASVAAATSAPPSAPATILVTGRLSFYPAADPRNRDLRLGDPVVLTDRAGRELGRATWEGNANAVNSLSFLMPSVPAGRGYYGLRYGGPQRAVVWKSEAEVRSGYDIVIDLN